MRSFHSRVPSSSPSKVVAELKTHYESSSSHSHFESDSAPSPPTPPPPILLFPNPRRENPHHFSALLLQIVALGASVLGILVRRGGTRSGRKETAKDGLESSRARQTRRLGEDGRQELIEINLLLSSYAALPRGESCEEEAGAIMIPSRMEMLALNTAVRPVVKLLESIGEEKPNHWTVMAVLAFATPIPRPERTPRLNLQSPALAIPSSLLSNSDSSFLTSVSPDQTSLYERSQPLFILWAWRTFIALHASPWKLEEFSTVDTSILQSFLAFAASTSTSPSMRRARLRIFEELSELLEERCTKAADSMPSPELLPHVSTVMVNFGIESLSIGHLPTFFKLLNRASSPLSLASRIALCSRSLERMRLDRDMRGGRGLVRAVFIALKDNIDVMAANLTAPLVPKVKGKRIRRIAPKFNVETLRNVEEAIITLLRGIKLDIAMESSITHIIVQILLCARSNVFTTTSGKDFITRVLLHMVQSRNPQLALRIFGALPRGDRTLPHYNAVLRSHVAAISNRIWLSLLRHPILRPDVLSLSSRLTSHIRKADPNLSAAREDWRIALELGVIPGLKEWNKLLHLVVQCGTPRQVRRCFSELKRHFKPDIVTFNIILGFHIRNEREGAKGLRRGASNIAAIKKDLKWIEGHKIEVNDVTKMIVLKGMTKWKREVGTMELVDICRKVMGLDLLERREPEMVEGPLLRPLEGNARAVAFRTIIGAFGKRGETRMRGRLIRIRARERRNR